MNQNVIYIGLDVDDTQYHGSALNTGTGEVITLWRWRSRQGNGAYRSWGDDDDDDHVYEGRGYRRHDDD